MKNEFYNKRNGEQVKPQTNMLENAVSTSLLFLRNTRDKAINATYERLAKLTDKESKLASIVYKGGVGAKLIDRGLEAILPLYIGLGDWTNQEIEEIILQISAEEAELLENQITLNKDAVPRLSNMVVTKLSRPPLHSLDSLTSPVSVSGLNQNISNPCEIPQDEVEATTQVNNPQKFVNNGGRSKFSSEPTKTSLKEFVGRTIEEHPIKLALLGGIFTAALAYFSIYGNMGSAPSTASDTNKPVAADSLAVEGYDLDRNNENSHPLYRR